MRKHPKGCVCRRCKFKGRRRRRRRLLRNPFYSRMQDPEDENKVREDIFDKVYKYFEVGTYEAVARECKKLTDSCDLCKGTGVDKGNQSPENPLEPRLCPRCTDARHALNVLEGLRVSAADVKPKAIVKDGYSK